MSGDEHPDASSDEDDLRTTGLIATRAKRSTAGNLYATLRQNLDDEELQKELLAEEEEDAGDYEGSDKDRDDDEAMDSSSDDEDSGPPKDGEAEDLEGERELKKAERAEARKKRKLEQAKMRVPAWVKKKRVKLADDIKTEDGAPQPPKKKLDRLSRLASGIDGPVRQSARASAVASREVTHAHLKQSAVRSEKQRMVMKDAARRERANKRAQLTQEERLAKAAKIEKETSREFGRWEREEAERQRIREEQLAAKRKRGVDGPAMRYWSGSVLWEGDKIKTKRLHGSTPIDELGSLEISEAIKDASAVADVSSARPDSAKPDTSIGASDTSAVNERQQQQQQQQQEGNTSEHLERQQQQQPPPPPPPAPSSTPPQQKQQQTPSVAPIALVHERQDSQQQEQPQTTWLEGIYEYAAQPPQASTTSTPSPAPPLYMPSAPAIHTPLEPALIPPLNDAMPKQHEEQHQERQGKQLPLLPAAPVCHVWSAGVQQPPPQQSQAHIPPEPLVREQAQRSLVMLEQFEKLDAPPPTKRGAGRAPKEAALEPSALASTLFPSSYPAFTPEESRYLSAKMRKRGPDHMLPPAPVKTRCAITSWPAKFRDPKTGLPYAELATYKIIQRMLAGGCAWSGFLGAWVGPAYGSIGRPAAGVPEGFAAPPRARPASADKAEGDVRQSA